jgi:hypothetical protein
LDSLVLRSNNRAPKQPAKMLGAYMSEKLGQKPNGGGIWTPGQNYGYAVWALLPRKVRIFGIVAVAT